MTAAADSDTKRRSLIKETTKWLSPLKRHQIALLSIGLYCSWMIASMASSLPFVVGERLFGNLYDIAFSGGFLAFCIPALLWSSRQEGLLGAIDSPGLLFKRRFSWSVTLAVLMVIVLMAFRRIPHDVLSGYEPLSQIVIAILGILVGMSFFWFIRATIAVFLQLDKKWVFLFCGGVLLFATAVFLVVSWLVVEDQQPWAWLIVLITSALLYRKAMKNANPRLRKAMDRAGTVLPPATPTLPPSASRSITSLLILNSFFLAFIIGNFPNIFHLSTFTHIFSLAGQMSDTSIGLSNINAIMAVTATALLLTAVGIFLSGRLFRLSFFSSIALLLLIGTSITVPMYNAFPVIVLIPIASASLLLAVQIYLTRSFSSVSYREADHAALVIMPKAGIGCLAAAVISAAHMALPVGGDDPRQIAIYALMIGIVALDVFIIVQLREVLMWLFFPTVEFSQPLDDTNLKGRCRIVASAYGLTRRETEVLELLSQGRDGPFIQKELGIARNTFKTHTLHIYQKMGVASKQALLDLLHEK